MEDAVKNVGATAFGAGVETASHALGGHVQL